MQKVYVKVAIDLIDECYNFFSKLRNFVGEFTVEGTDLQNYQNDTIVISFYTDRVMFKEGSQKLVELVAMRAEDGSWNFTELKKCYHDA